ncbi:hypothetical protein Cgig2_000943 [Carnegiea gigantea]|uniref:Uncharacterized protein n=1 Tax=Carnegiea gigantea TaxID=171969 RepID=A0A9Q1JIN0_9CARY|nr:hypothetical protein Cgig2_000943 [Carnegiea gigantea]
MGKIRLWAIKSISFTGRAQLLNSMATIFILPQEVIDQLNQICRNHLLGGGARGMANYQKSPYISWNKTCTPRKYGGIGLKNFGAWNKICIAKIVWIAYGSNGCTEDTLNSKNGWTTRLHLTAVGIKKNWWQSRTFSLNELQIALLGNGKGVRETLSKRATNGCLGRWSIRNGVRLYGPELQLPGTHLQLGFSFTKSSQ